VEALLSTVFRMDRWMEENGSSQVTEEEFVGRVRRKREEALAVRWVMRDQIRSARKALSAGKNRL
jgi:hypothetical protein